MEKLHAKSPCCRGEIKRYGNRRRQCFVCKKTWRIRIKKRGRKKKREQKELIIRYLQHEIPSLCILARMKKTTERVLQSKLNRSLEYFLSHTPWPQLPQKGELIVIADAMIRCVERKWYTSYFILVREVGSNEAIIAPPFIRKGTEVVKGWYEAFDRLPDATRANIKAIVCDGHVGLTSIAKWEGWILQRCQFHLIARIQGRCSRWGRSRNKERGQHIYDLVKHILTTTDEESIMSKLSEIEEIGWLSNSPDLKKTLSGFVKRYKDYRSCLYYPELNLPTTSNTAECLISCIKRLFGKAKGFCTIKSFEKWICAFIKNKKKIKCNGYYQPN